MYTPPTRSVESNWTLNTVLPPGGMVALAGVTASQSGVRLNWIAMLAWT